MKRKSEVCKAFNTSARSYAAAAKVQEEIGMRMCERLQYLKIEPSHILDLGCGPGTFLNHLNALYPKAQIIGVDLALNMLTVAQSQQRWWRKSRLVNANMVQLPFKDGQFALIFANQVIHWSVLAPCLRELQRVLTHNGCLMFSTLGPDTFKEIRQAFAAIDTFTHTNNFIDMHDIGDCLTRELFEDPVVDMEMLAAHYSNSTTLLKSLKEQGVRNIHEQRRLGLTGRDYWHRFDNEMQKFQTETGKIPLTYEVIYGHAWKGNLSHTPTGVETRIPLSQLKRRA